MTLQKWVIFIMGAYGEISHFLSDPTEICFWLYKKPWHTLWKFQLKIISNKKVIAKKPLTNLYEMNSSWRIRMVITVTLSLALVFLWNSWLILAPACNELFKEIDWIINTYGLILANWVWLTIEIIVSIVTSNLVG